MVLLQPFLSGQFTGIKYIFTGVKISPPPIFRAFSPPYTETLYPLNCVTPWASKVVLGVKNLPANAEDKRDMSSIPELVRSPREEHCNPLQYSCLENPIDKGAWWAIVHSVAESDMTEATWHSCM